MLRDRARELLPIIQAFADGKAIEYKNAGNWKLATGPDWSNDIQYRIKPEPKLVPFTFEDKDLFKNKWFKLKTTSGLFKASYMDKSLIAIGASQNSYFELMQLFEFEDGSPCGKYINE